MVGVDGAFGFGWLERHPVSVSGHHESGTRGHRKVGAPISVEVGQSHIGVLEAEVERTVDRDLLAKGCLARVSEVARLGPAAGGQEVGRAVAIEVRQLTPDAESENDGESAAVQSRPGSQ